MLQNFGRSVVETVLCERTALPDTRPIYMPGTPQTRSRTFHAGTPAATDVSGRQVKRSRRRTNTSFALRETVFTVCAALLPSAVKRPLNSGSGKPASRRFALTGHGSRGYQSAKEGALGPDTQNSSAPAPFGPETSCERR